MFSTPLCRRSTVVVSWVLFLILSLPLTMFPQSVFAQSVAAQSNATITSAHHSAGTQSTNIVVTSDVVWKDTGISTNVGDTLNVSATGSWSADPNDGSTGPDGYAQQIADNFFNLTDIGACSTCASTPAPHWGALIGYIGNNPPAAGSYTSPSILSDAQKVFVVGSNFQSNATLAGELWLTFNDDAYSANTGDNAGQVTATVTDTPSGPLGGTWITPTNNFVVKGDTLHFAAHAYGGVGGVDHVNFTASFLGVKQIWYIACKVLPTAGTNSYACDWQLSPSVPNGSIKVGFDVYDTSGNRILSPNGIRLGVINRPMHSQLLAPMPSGTKLKIVHGYNDPLPSENCPPSGPNRADHCMNQAYGLDFVPTGAATDIIAPASGTVAWLSSDCLGLRLDLGDVNLTICHFASFNPKLGSGVRVVSGGFLGTWKGNIHLSIDDRYHDQSPGSGCTLSTARTCRPVPFNAGYFTIEGISFNPGFDKNGNPIRDQYDGFIFVSTNVEQK